MTEAALDEFWQRAMSAIKGRIIQPSLWRALEQMKPLVLDEDILVLGLSSGEGYHASQVASSDRRNAIEGVLQQMSNRRMSFRVIDGDSIEDWESVKRRESITRESEMQRRAVRDREKGVEDSWEAVSDEIYRIYSRIPLKQLPQNRAAFFAAAMPVILEACRRLLSGPNADQEANQRAYARVLEKVATLADLSATHVAFVLQQAREKNP